MNTPTSAIPEKEWNIYKITNPRGRVYIGKTSNLKRRLSAYRGLDCKNQTLLYRSLLKYRFDNHTIKILDTFTSDVKYANDKEIFWIRTFMSFNNVFPDRYGMNMCIGGSGTLGRKPTKTQIDKIIATKSANPYRHTDAAKEKISMASRGNKYNLGKKQSPELIAKRMASSYGHKRSYGKIHSLETREKMSASKRGKQPSKNAMIAAQKANMARSKPICQYDSNEVFISEYKTISEASRILSIHRSGIRRVIQGKAKKAGGFIFKQITICH